MYCNVSISREFGGRYNEESKPIIRFYDALFAGNPRFEVIGQFTGGSYYLETLLRDREDLCRQGLSLHGGVKEWYVTGEQMRHVFALIDAWIINDEQPRKSIHRNVKDVS